MRNPAIAAETDIAAQAVVDCLDQLKEPQRRCILMAYYYGHTHNELSTMMRVPLGVIKAWIRRGMGKLRECHG
ncbi:MAG TPA: sigma factor-like helix-turn-helix DNA-binding protein [Gammaproteobacteria bacterium]|nr:sigma factor-like helix-turn-helix DNA-binding protein [Gammaproteobacteria bacterium]